MSDVKRPDQHEFAKEVSDYLTVRGERALTHDDQPAILRGWLGRLSVHETAAMIQERRDERKAMQEVEEGSEGDGEHSD